MAHRPYQANAKKVEGGYTICIYSKRNGKFLPISGGTFISDAQTKVKGTFQAAVQTELDKAGWTPAATPTIS